MDRALHNTLSRWARQQVPPIVVRRELMRTVREEACSPRQDTVRQPSDFFAETLYLGPVINFNQGFGMVFSLQARVRF
jgi:hypothetical protein